MVKVSQTMMEHLENACACPYRVLTCAYRVRGVVLSLPRYQANKNGFAQQVEVLIHPNHTCHPSFFSRQSAPRLILSPTRRIFCPFQTTLFLNKLIKLFQDVGNS
jgi:hypothetical protein